MQGRGEIFPLRFLGYGHIRTGPFDRREEILTYTFSSETKWPAEDKMPPGYSPDSILSLGKDLGLGLSALHDAGVTGKGVPAAVIDKPIPKDHEAYSANLRYIEVKPGDEKMGETRFHGAACATILAGKYGVAPEAPLYYFAVPDDAQPYKRYAEALTMLLDMREEMPEEEKIRIVSVSYGIQASQEGASEWQDAIARAEERASSWSIPECPGSISPARAVPRVLTGTTRRITSAGAG